MFSRNVMRTFKQPIKCPLHVGSGSFNNISEYTSLLCWVALHVRDTRWRCVGPPLPVFSFEDIIFKFIHLFVVSLFYVDISFTVKNVECGFWQQINQGSIVVMHLPSLWPWTRCLTLQRQVPVYALRSTLSGIVRCLAWRLASAH